MRKQRFLFGIILGVVAIAVTLTSASLFRGGSDGASAVGPTPTKIANDSFWRRNRRARGLCRTEAPL